MRTYLFIALSLALVSPQLITNEAWAAEDEQGQTLEEQEEQRKQEARLLYRIAMKANEEGRFDVAARTFDEANRLYGHITLVWNAARAYHNGGELQAARARYRECLEDDQLPSDKRTKAVDYLVEVELALRKPPAPDPAPTAPVEESPPAPAQKEPEPAAPSPSLDEPPQGEDAPAVEAPQEAPATTAAEQPVADDGGQGAAKKAGTKRSTADLKKMAQTIRRGMSKAAQQLESTIFGEERAPGVPLRRHGFARASLSFGGAWANIDGSFRDSSSGVQSAGAFAGELGGSGSSFTVTFKGGWHFNQQLILHGEARAAFMREGAVSLDGDVTGTAASGGASFDGHLERTLELETMSAAQLSLLAGATLYVYRDILYTDLGLGMGAVTLTEGFTDFADVHRSGFGPAMSLGIGADLWVEDVFALGVALKYSGNWASMDDDTRWSYPIVPGAATSTLDDGSLGYHTLGVEFSVTLD